MTPTRTVYTSGIEINEGGATRPGVFDASSFDDALVAISRALASTTNAQGIVVQFVIDPSGKGPGYQKNALAAYIVQNDPSSDDGTLAGQTWKDAVALDVRAFAPPTNPHARIWGAYIQPTIGYPGSDTGDGAMVGIDVVPVNHGSDQAEPGNWNSKIGVAVTMANGDGTPGNGTIAYSAGAAPGQLIHKMFYTRSESIGKLSRDGAFIVDPYFAVKWNGRTCIGFVETPNGDYMLDVLGGMRVQSRAADGLTMTIDGYGHQAFSQAKPPTTTAYAGAGTGAVIEVVGTDQSGYLSVTTGAAPQGYGQTLCAVHFRTPREAPPIPVTIEPANPAARDLTRAQDVIVLRETVRGTEFYVICGQSALAAGVTYEWSYRCN